MKYRLSGKICLISLIVLLSLGIWGCAADEGNNEPQLAEEQNTEENEKSPGDAVPSDTEELEQPVTDGETCWTELALSR